MLNNVHFTNNDSHKLILNNAVIVYNTLELQCWVGVLYWNKRWQCFSLLPIKAGNDSTAAADTAT